MSAPVDVLAVLDDMASTVQLVSHEHKAWHARIVEARATVAELIEVSNRTIRAFEAYGKAQGLVAEARAHQECEAAMVTQKAALANVGPQS